MKPKLRTMYLHTIDGKPAGYDDFNEQIIFACVGFAPLLCKSLAQVRREQKLTMKNRIKWGMDGPSGRYGYRLVRIPQEPLP